MSELEKDLAISNLFSESANLSIWRENLDESDMYIIHQVREQLEELTK